MHKNSAGMDDLRIIVQALSQAEAVERLFKYSEGWKVVHEAFKKLSNEAADMLGTVDPGDTVRIIELQQIKRIYARLYDIFKSSKLIADEAEQALAEMEDNDGNEEY